MDGGQNQVRRHGRRQLRIIYWEWRAAPAPDAVRRALAPNRGVDAGGADCWARRPSHGPGRARSPMIMNKPSRKIEWLVWGGLVLIIAVIAGAFAWYETGADAAIAGHRPDSQFHPHQPGQPASFTGELRGKVWMADMIFTRCAGPCPIMTHHLAELQAALPANEPVRLITFTSDPEYDTPAVLKRYATRFGCRYKPVVFPDRPQTGNPHSGRSMISNLSWWRKNPVKTGDARRPVHPQHLVCAGGPQGHAARLDRSRRPLACLF